MQDECEAPVVLIVDGEPLNRRNASGILAADGWRVATASDGRSAIAMMEPAPALVLMDLHMAGMSGADTVAAIRQGGDCAASTPVLAYTTRRLTDLAALRAHGFDGFVQKRCSPAELVAAARRWLPDDFARTLDRLENGFGTEQIGSITNRFRDLLVEALARMDSSEIQPIAHRVAGIAGMLGFAAAGRAWLALAEGDDAARDEARVASRRAVAAIDRRCHR